MPAICAQVIEGTENERGYQLTTKAGYRHYCSSCQKHNTHLSTFNSSERLRRLYDKKMVNIEKGKKTCEECLAKRRKGKKTKDQIIAEKDKRIAELEAEVARLSQLVENSNA